MAQKPTRLSEYRSLQSEADFLKAVIEYARLKGWLVYHVHEDAATPRVTRGSDPGFVDLVLAKQGRLVCAELKTKRRRPSPSQAVWLAVLRTVEGVQVRVWWPDDWLDIEEVLT